MPSLGEMTRQVFAGEFRRAVTQKTPLLFLLPRRPAPPPLSAMALARRRVADAMTDLRHKVARSIFPEVFDRLDALENRDMEE